MAATVDLIARLKTEGDGAFNSSLGRVNDSLRTLGKISIGAAVAGVTALGAGFAASVNSAANFQQAMSNVGAISLASADDLAKLEAAALSAGSTTAFTATEAAEGLAFLAMAGFDVGESITALPSVLAAASAGNMDLATTADIVSNVLGGFRLSADEAKRAADVLAMTSANSNTNIEMLGQTMKFAAPTAANLGWSLEEVAASAGFLADAGIQSSLAGTHLRAIMGSLATPTQGAQKALAGLGIELRHSSGEMRSMENIVTDLEHALGDVGPAQRDFALNAIFGREAAGSFSILLGRGGEALGDYAHELEGATEMQGGLGAAGVQAEMQLDNFRGAMTLLRSAVDGAMVAIGSRFLPALQTMAQSAIPMVEWAMITILPVLDRVLGVFTRFFERLELGLSPTRALVGALRMAGFRQIGDAVQFLSDKFFEMKDIVTEFLQPIIDFVAESVKLQDILVVLGIAVATVVIPALLGLVGTFLAFIAPILAVIAVVSLLRQAWESDFGGIQGKTAEVYGYLQKNTGTTFTQLKDQFFVGLAYVTGLVEKGWKNIQNFWAHYGERIGEITSTAWTFIKDLVTVIGAVIVASVLAFWEKLKTVWATYGDNLTAIAVILWNGMVGLFSGVFDILAGLVASFIAIVTGDWEGLHDALSRIGEGIVTVLTTAFTTGLAFITELFVIAVDDIMNAFGRPDWAETGVNIVRGIGAGIASMAGWLAGKAAELAQAAYNAVTGFFQEQSPSKLMANSGVNFVLGLADGITDTTGDAVEAVTAMARNMSGVAIEPSMAFTNDTSAGMGFGGGGFGGGMTINVYIDGGTSDMQNSARTGVGAALKEAGLSADIRRRI